MKTQENLHPQIKECLRLPKARREAWNRFSIPAHEGTTLPTSWFQILHSRADTINYHPKRPSLQDFVTASLENQHTLLWLNFSSCLKYMVQEECISSCPPLLWLLSSSSPSLLSFADMWSYHVVGIILSTLNWILVAIYEMHPIVIPILQTKKLRHREVNYQESHS